jgi:hypothetical protein
MMDGRRVERGERLRNTSGGHPCESQPLERTGPERPRPGACEHQFGEGRLRIGQVECQGQAMDPGDQPEIFLAGLTEGPPAEQRSHHRMEPLPKPAESSPSARAKPDPLLDGTAGQSPRPSECAQAR